MTMEVYCFLWDIPNCGTDIDELARRLDVNIFVFDLKNKFEYRTYTNRKDTRCYLKVRNLEDANISFIIHPGHPGRRQIVCGDPDCGFSCVILSEFKRHGCKSQEKSCKEDVFGGKESELLRLIHLGYLPKHLENWKRPFFATFDLETLENAYHDQG